MITESIPAEKLALIRLAMTPGIGPRMIEHLLEHFLDPVAVFAASDEKLGEVPRMSSRMISAIRAAQRDTFIEHSLQWCHEHQTQVLVSTDEQYPQNLRGLAGAPPVLFMRGDLLARDSLAVAIVGSRHATNYGLRQAARLARELALAGVTIVSGLARGIDAAAHRGALEAGGRTLAVLGGGLANIYPPEHVSLADEVCGQGAVLSEFAPHSQPKGSMFPQRNRVISGISLGVIVIEAADRSGSLITARHAAEQGREVFALPGPVTSRVSRGCHQLIRDGAHLVTCGDEVLEHLGPIATPIQRDDKPVLRQGSELLLNDQEQAVLNVIETEPTSIDQICRTSQIPIQRVLATISVLEMRRLIRRLSGQYVSRI